MTIVGIDIGTQSLKAVVTDDDLAVLGQASSPYQVDFPRPGWAEQDPGLWERALAPTVKRALAAAGREPEDVSALGVGGQLDGCIAVGGDGKPLHPCLIWMDRRAEAEIEGLPAGEIRQRSGVILDATHLAAKIRWLHGHLADGGPVARFHVPTSYMVHRLTGRHVMDHGLASTTMLYSLAGRQLDPWLLDLFEIDPAILPDIDDAAAAAGPLTAEGARLSGLPAGIPVAVGTGDDFTTPLGAGIVSPGKLACVLGTAEVVGAVHPDPVIDGGGLVETHAYVGGDFFIENPGWLSGGALAWFKDTWRLENFKELDSLAGQIPPGAGGLTFLPALSGCMAPEWVASARGCFYGLTPAHGTGHLARAVLEGTAFAMRDVVQRLQSLGVRIEVIHLLGGGAKSRVWAKIRADLTGLVVEIPALTDTAPVGSAMLAAVAAAIQPDMTAAAAAARAGGPATLIEPDLPARPAYDDAYGRYNRLFESLRPMF